MVLGSDRDLQKDVAHRCNDHYCSGIFRAIGHRIVDCLDKFVVVVESRSIRGQCGRLVEFLDKFANVVDIVGRAIVDDR